MTREVEVQSSADLVNVQAHAKPDTANHLANKTGQAGIGVSADATPLFQAPTRQSRQSKSAKGAKESERLCVVTRNTLPSKEMLRFVVSPDNQLVPDLKENLPGRGAWITNNRSMLETAIKKKLFAKSFKRNLEVNPALGEQIEELMRRAILGKLSLARKAGLVTTGFNKVLETLRKKDVLLVLHAREAAEDGRKQITAAIRAREKNNSPHQTTCIYDGFSGEELDLVLGNFNITHAAVEAAPLSLSLLEDLAKLNEYQELDSDIGAILADRENDTDNPPDRVPDQAEGGG